MGPQRLLVGPPEKSLQVMSGPSWPSEPIQLVGAACDDGKSCAVASGDQGVGPRSAWYCSVTCKSHLTFLSLFPIPQSGRNNSLCDFYEFN